MSSDASCAPCILWESRERQPRPDDGSTLVVWSRELVPNESAEIRGRIYQPDRQPLGPSFVIDTTDLGLRQWPDLAATFDDLFAVVWQRDHGTDQQIHLRHVAFDGDMANPDRGIGSYTGTGEARPRVGASGRGLLVVWYSNVLNEHELRATYLPRVVE